ncbi:MAG TPA: Gfo/Idh/MocA family oxidoreductase, partial [Steroidobacteraceae bacterium]
MSKVVWGILSTANIGIKRVIPAILSGRRGVIAAIASRDAERAREVAARFGIARSYGSYQALLDDPQVEAIYNPLPNHLHVEWTVKALEAGKHVLCEKPIALNAVEAQAILAARDRSGRRVIEAFMVRFHPQWHRVRSLVREGRIGKVRALLSAFTFPVASPDNVRNRIEYGGGALYDVGCYPIVTARYLLGTEPERAIALVDRDPALGVDRVTSGLVAFPGGEQLLLTSALQLALYQRVVVLGTQGRIEIAVPFTPPKE